MAKNIVKKKQRIAHNKTHNEDHEMLFEGNDILFGIFEEMEKNNDLSAIHLNNFEANLSETNKTFNQQKTQHNKIPLPSQNHASVSKSKMFGLSRKFPLMEKCTRALKQIKHNRQMPKPRAHLALLNSPKSKVNVAGLSNKLTFNSNLVSNVVSEKLKVVKKDLKNSCKSQNKVAEKLQNDRVPTLVTEAEKNFNQQPKTKEIPSKNCKSVKIKKNTEESSCLIVDQTVVFSSDSDEYEKFIQKVCPKKSKNKKISKKPQQATKVIKKRISKPISSESHSDMSDDETTESSKPNKKKCKKLKKRELKGNRQSTFKGEDVNDSKRVKKKRNSRAISKSVSSESDSDMSGKSSNHRNTRSKRIKRRHEVLDNRKSTSQDSESEMDIANDGTYHDSSSESGDLQSFSKLTRGSKSNSYACQSSEQFSMHNPVSEYNSLSYETSGKNSNNMNLYEAVAHKTSDISSLMSNDNHNISIKTPDIVSLAGNDNVSVSNKIPDIVPLSANKFKSVLQNKTSSVALSVNNNWQNISCETPVAPLLVSSAQPNAFCKTSNAASIINNDCLNVSHKTPVSSLVGSAKLNKEYLSAKNDSLNNSMQKNSSKSAIVDLTESDNECESSFTIMPKIVMTSGQIPNESLSHSEESDIELLDVIIAKLPEKDKTKCSAENIKHSSNDINIANKLAIKTEMTDQRLSRSSAKPQSIPDLQASLTYEVAYSTGICQGYDKNTDSKDNIISQLNLNNNKCENSIVSTASNSQILSKNVKKEPCDDECEIVLDITSSNNTNFPTVQICNNTNIKTEKNSNVVKKVAPVGFTMSDSSTIEQSDIISNTKTSLILSRNVKKEPGDDDCEIVLDIVSSSNSNIKIERDSKTVKQVRSVNVASGGSITTEQKNKLSQKKKKFHEVACSNLKDSPNKNSELLDKGEIVDQDTMNIKVLLQDLKKEFATYQDILQTEQSVENTFKLLERSQAEKLMSLKSKITQFLESTPSNSDCNSIKNAVDKLLDSSELSSLSLKDSAKVHSVCHNQTSMSDISVEDLKTFATMNLVPLSSICENDIKPNLSELQCALKKEASTSDEINSMSFGEKCVVCTKDASAACQQCAKVFFCSNECGRKYWEGGHRNACAK